MCWKFKHKQTGKLFQGLPPNMWDHENVGWLDLGLNMEKYCLSSVFDLLSNESDFVLADVDNGAAAVDSSAERESGASGEISVQEPYVGMEFDSEDAAKEFYDEYARRVGFVMRIDQCRRSEVDKRILSRRLSCNKQGYYVKMKDQYGPVRKPRSSTREGCKAMMLVKMNKSGKWVVSRFLKNHTHPLVASDRPCPNAMDHKDQKIQELTVELERQDKLCDLYHEQIITFLKSVEEQTELLSTKIEAAVNNVRELEAEVKQHENQQ